MVLVVVVEPGVVEDEDEEGGGEGVAVHKVRRVGCVARWAARRMFLAGARIMLEVDAGE